MGNLNNKRRKFKNLRALSIQVSIVHTSKTFRVPPHLYMVHRSFSTHVRLLGLFQTRIGLFRSLAQIVLAPIAFTEFRISTAPGSFPKSPTQATQTEHRGPPTNQTAHKHVTKVIGTSHAVTRGIYLFTNKDLTNRRIKAVEDAGAFRAPTNAARSFNPQYGDVQQLRAVDSMTVRSTEGRETLLKLALPAPQGSGNAAGRLTRRGRQAAVRQLDDFLAPPRPRTLD